MERITSWICLTAAVLATAHAQLQLIGNSVVDENFFVVGELQPGETFDQFTRRFRPESGAEGRSLTRTTDPEAPRVPTAASSSEPLGLSSGAAELLGRIDESFSCEGLPYGYYSDSSNDCRVYHVCNPGQDGTQTNQYSFFCNEGTEFDQQLLTCVHESPDRSACSNARQFYESSNSQFFRDGQFNADASLPALSTPDQPSDGNDVVFIGVTGGVPADKVLPLPETVLTGTQGVNNAVSSVSDEGSIDGAGLLDLRLGLPGF